MCEPKTHGPIRIGLTIIGLNGLVMGVWLVMNGTLDSRALQSYVRSAEAVVLGVNWPWSVQAMVEWLALFVLSGVLFATAALRVAGLTARSDSASDHDHVPRPPGIPGSGYTAGQRTVGHRDEPGYTLMAVQEGSALVVCGGTDGAQDSPRARVVRVVCASVGRSPRAERAQTRQQIQHLLAGKWTVISSSD
jgi:hypothetical protein